MSTKVHHLIQPLTGTKDLYTLLEVIGNVKKYKKLLLEYETKRSEVNETIALVGKAKDIPMLHKQAKEAERLAGENILAAKQKAERIVSLAVEKAKKIQDEVEADQSRLCADKTKFKSESESILKESEKALNQGKALAKEAEARIVKADVTRAAGERARVEYETKIKNYRKIVSEL